MKVLFVGDAVAPTGFARVTHSLCDRFHAEGHVVKVLGINYTGDPHKYPYAIYPAAQFAGQDSRGLDRYEEIAKEFRPDVVVILGDPWVVAKFKDKRHRSPVIGYMPVDGMHMRLARDLNWLEVGVFYTQFGLEQARLGGFTGTAAVVPHGVDAVLYRPIEREVARHEAKLPIPAGAFVVGNVNRNSHRKRLDLTVKWWASWWHQEGCPRDAYLYFHCSLFDEGWDLIDLAAAYGVPSRQIILTSKTLDTWKGIPQEKMPLVYNSMDVQVNTGQGEGWGLCQHEGMACAIAQILVRAAALGEWAHDGAVMIPVAEHAVTPGHVNVIGAIGDGAAFVEALSMLYHDRALRTLMSVRALSVATDPRYQWDDIAQQFLAIFDHATCRYAERKAEALATEKAAADALIAAAAVESNA